MAASCVRWTPNRMAIWTLRGGAWTRATRIATGRVRLSRVLANPTTALDRDNRCADAQAPSRREESEAREVGCKAAKVSDVSRDDDGVE